AGNQFTTFNTFQPSLDRADANNLVTNWIQITNLDLSPQTGTIYFYSQAGTVLASQPVTLAAGARQDFSGHQFGTNLVGIIKWSPDSNSAKFLMRNVRYYYDNPGTANSFVSAMQIEGLKGNGELLTVPLDTVSNTAVLEVANVTSAPITAAVNFYDG